MKKFYIVYDENDLTIEELYNFQKSIKFILNQSSISTEYDCINLEYGLIKISEIDNFKFKKYEEYTKFIFVIGDGNLLSKVARTFYNYDTNNERYVLFPIKIGFLSQYTLDDILSEEVIFDDFTKLLTDEYSIDKRPLLEIEYDGKLYYALNNFIFKRDNTKMLHSCITVKDEKECFNEEHTGYNYTSDGIVISTPTGSTGYNLNVGGPIVDPHSKSLIITPINPLKIRSMSYPIIVNNDYDLEIELIDFDNYDNIHPYGYIDGEDHFMIEYEKPIYVRESKCSVAFANINGNSFYNIVIDQLCY